MKAITKIKHGITKFKKINWSTPIAVLFLSFILLSGSNIDYLKAAISSGWAWGGTSSSDSASTSAYTGIGWLSLSGTAGGTPYKLNMPVTNGTISGYAWAGEYGWLSFNSGDLTGCPFGNCQAGVNNGNVTGWARFLAIKNNATNSGGFDGWVSLAGTAQDSTKYGLGYVNGTFSGRAWSPDLGWISFSDISNVTLTPISSTISLGDTISFDSVATSIDSSMTSHNLNWQKHGVNCWNWDTTCFTSIATVSTSAYTFPASPTHTMNVSFTPTETGLYDVYAASWSSADTKWTNSIIASINVTSTQKCANGTVNYPTCTVKVDGSCLNRAVNAPGCTVKADGSCVNGAVNPVLCTVNANGSCLNGATNPLACNTANTCKNGTVNYSLCTLLADGTCENGAVNPEACTVDANGSCLNGSTDAPACTNVVITPPVLPPKNNSCSNNATNYPDCTTINGQCINGYKNPPTCAPTNNTTIPPVDNNEITENIICNTGYTFVGTSCQPNLIPNENGVAVCSNGGTAPECTMCGGNLLPDSYTIYEKCLNDTTVATKKVSYYCNGTNWSTLSKSVGSCPALPTVISLTANPSTLNVNSSTTLTWDISAPDISADTCTLKAFIPNGITHTALRDANITSLNSLLAGKTDAADPYGSKRIMSEALNIKTPFGTSNHARGQITVPIKYDVEFISSCSTSEKKVRIHVSSNIEG